MTSEPTTPVRIPKAAGSYTHSTQDPDLRSEVNSILLKEGHVVKIQEAILHSLNASSTNWPTLIQEHALSLLRSGTCTNFPELMSRVMSDIKHDTAVRRSAAKQTNGAAVNGKSSQSLALPEKVVEDGLRFTREALNDVLVWWTLMMGELVSPRNALALLRAWIRDEAHRYGKNESVDDDSKKDAHFRAPLSPLPKLRFKRQVPRDGQRYMVIERQDGAQVVVTRKTFKRLRDQGVVMNIHIHHKCVDQLQRAGIIGSSVRKEEQSMDMFDAAFLVKKEDSEGMKQWRKVTKDDHE